MSPPISAWNGSDSVKSNKESPDSTFSRRQLQQSDIPADTTGSQRNLSDSIWFNDYLSDFDSTAHLNSQEPATLYYLYKLINIDGISSVYVEKRNNGSRKHWAVMSERDYDLMDNIYDIEEKTRDSFPLSDLSFRVTVDSEGGPSVSKDAVKIYDKN